jgi:hypothetical protein
MIHDNYAACNKTKAQQPDYFKPNSSGVTLVVVVILAAVAGILAAGLHFASGSRITQVRQEMRFEKAFFVAEAGIERAKANLRTNVATGALFGGLTSYGEGRFHVSARNSASGTNRFIIRSTGTVETAARVIEVEVERTPFVPPQTDGAFGIYGTNTKLTVQSAAALLDGNDYNLPPALGDDDKNPSGNPAMPGIFYSSTSTVFDLKTGAVTGTPNLTNGVSAYSETEWAQFVNDNMPPNFYTVGDFMGNRNNPIITILQPGVTTKLNANTTGAGILIVPGDATLKMSGGFAYEGLVIIYTGGTIAVGDASLTGTADIFGAIVCIGGNLDIDVSGTFDLNYSTAALANLANLQVPARLDMIYWKEIKASSTNW